MKTKNLENYWKRNLRYLLILLSIWFVASYGCGILFADELNNIRVGGFKLGFWFAQQGSIYVFVVLIFVYVALMNKLDKAFDVDEQEAPDERKIHIKKPNPPKPSTPTSTLNA